MEREVKKWLFFTRLSYSKPAEWRPWVGELKLASIDEETDVAQGCKGNVGRDLEKKSITNPKLHHLQFAEHHHQVLENFLKHFHSSNQHS